MIELILVAVLLGLIVSIAIVETASARTTALQNQVDGMISHLDYVRIKLQTTRNVGQLGIAATNEIVWPEDQDFTLSFDATGKVDNASDPTIQLALERYLLKDQNIGLVLRNLVGKGISPKIKTPLTIADGINIDQAMDLTYDVSTSSWVLSN